MDAHHIDLVPDPAVPEVPHSAVVGMAPMGAAANAAAELTATFQPVAEGNATDAQRKRLATLQAVLARKGFELHPTASGIYVVTRWNLARTLTTLDKGQDFAQQVGVPQC